MEWNIIIIIIIIPWAFDGDYKSGGDGELLVIWYMLHYHHDLLGM